MMLPKKKSPRWILVLLILFALNLAALLGSRLVLGYLPETTVAIEYAVISLIISLIACAGFFGLRLFSSLAILADAIAIAYMYYILLWSSTAGWKDLISMLGYMYILIVGIIAAAVIQGIVFGLKKRRKKGA